MALEDYLKTKEKATSVVEGMNFLLRKAILEAQEKHLMDGSELYYSKLNDSKTRSAYLSTFNEVLNQGVRKYLGLPDTFEADSFRSADLMHAYLGLTPVDTQAVIEGLKENATFENITKELSRPLGEAIKRKMMLPVNSLSLDDADEVLNKYQCQKIVDKEKLKITDLAALIEAGEQYGIITEKMIEGAPYTVSKASPLWTPGQPL